MQPKHSQKESSQAGSKKEHDKIVAQTLILLGREASHIGRFFPNPTGVAYRDRTFHREYVRYGIPGSPDIIGIMIGGFWVGIEIKSGNAKQQKNQRAFQLMINSFGGFYMVAKSADEALDSILRAAISCN